MGKKSRRKRERRASPPPPVGKQPSSWRQRRQLIVLAGAVVAAGGLAAGLGIALSSSSRAGVKLAPLSSLPANIPGLDVDEPPWPAEHTRLGSRLDALGFPRLQMEAEVLHIHQHLDIYVNGHHATVSALIGIDAQENFISPVHTHDATGIIHIESPFNYLGRALHPTLHRRPLCGRWPTAPRLRERQARRRRSEADRAAIASGDRRRIRDACAASRSRPLALRLPGGALSAPGNCPARTVDRAGTRCLRRACWRDLPRAR